MRSLLVFVIISLVAVCSCTSKQLKQEAVLRENLTYIRELLDQYYSDKGTYPHTLKDLVTLGYLKELPLDPITGRNDTWVAIYEDLDATPDPKTKPGIYDVKSGAAGNTLDGRPYEEL